MNFLLQHLFVLAVVQCVLSVEVTAPQQLTENVTVTGVLGKENVTVTEVLGNDNVTVTEVLGNENATVTEVLGNDNVTVTEVLGKENVTKTIVEEHFAGSQLVPDIIPVAPKELIELKFPSGVNASLGNKLTPTQVKDVPTLSWTAGIDQYYTLIAIDPDLPSRKKPLFRSTLHWCVMNILGTNISSGDTIADYISAGPPEKSGLHRLTFLVYKQPGIIEFNETRLSDTSSYGRHGFSVTEFAKKYNLGNPVAGNFFQTSYDSYVSILYRKLEPLDENNSSDSDESSSPCDVATAFIEAKITPDYCETPPKKFLKVVSSGGGEVNLGNKMFPDEWLQKPTISYDADPDCLYTFVMIDLDAPYPGVITLPETILHCLVADIKGNDISTGNEFAKYIAANPPPLSEPHRYIQLVYQQDGPMKFDAEDGELKANRIIFNLSMFVSKHKLGDPVYGNYFNGFPEEAKLSL